MGYSTKGVVIVAIAIIGIEVGIVVEVVQPRGPSNVCSS